VVALNERGRLLCLGRHKVTYDFALYSHWLSFLTDTLNQGIIR
jgi:hypothetical protein